MEGEEGGGGVDWDSLAEAASGAVGALVSTTVLYPLDTCKTKFQADVHTDQGPNKYRSAPPSPPPSTPLSLLVLDSVADCRRLSSVGR
jgi:hypothetical protein